MHEVTLCDAVKNRDYTLTLVEKLLSNGANPNHVDKEGNTALTYAAKTGYRPMIEFLISHGADPTHVDKVGWTL